MKRFLLLITSIIPIIAVSLLISPPKAFASDQNPATCSDANMHTAITGASSDGDTITVPAGNCDITTAWVITKGITINCHAGRDTVFADKASHAAPTIQINSGSANFHINNCKFVQGNDAPPTNQTETWLSIDGTATRWEFNNIQIGADIDHPLSAVRIFNNDAGCNYGAIHNSTIYVYNEMMLVGQPACNSNIVGNGSWAANTDFGSLDAAYIENNILSTNGAVSNAAIVDTIDGARLVVRLNTIDRLEVGGHGTESGQDRRGSRKYEVYGNVADHTNGNPLNGDFPEFVNLRGGTALIFHNTLTGYLTAVEGFNFRANNAYPPFHGSDDKPAAVGQSAYDDLDGTVYATGMHNGANGASLVLTDSGGSFAAYKPTLTSLPGGQEYTGGINFSICNTTKNWCTAIVDATTTTITGMQDINLTDACNVGICTGGHMTWATNDVYQVLKARSVLDGAGRGKSITFTSSGGVGTHPSPISAALNDLDPTYAFDNTGTNVDGYTASRNYDPYVQNGRDIITDKPTSPNKVHPSGTSLPATCTAPTDWFWKTNGTNWNDGSNSNYTGDGDGYKCLITNTWTKVYTPANYPWNGSSSPALISVSASSGTQGNSNLSLTFTGSSTNWVNGTSVASFSGTGITVNSTTVSSSTAATVSITIASNATTGTRDVTMTTGAEVVSLSNYFTVIPSAVGIGAGRLRLGR